MSEEKTVTVSVPEGRLPHRIKRLLVDPRFFSMQLKQGMAFRVLEGLPPDSRVAGSGFDTERQCFVLLIEHDSFEPLKAGQEIPDIEPIRFEDIRDKLPLVGEAGMSKAMQ